MFRKLALLLTSLLMTSSQVQAGPIQAEPVDSPWWHERHEEYRRLAQSENVQVLFLGDSITDLWRGEGRSVWRENFEPLASANFGIGGDKVENVLWRIRNGELDRITPEVVVLLVGTNNLESDSVEDTLATEAVLTAEIRHRLPKARLLIFGIFPRVDERSTEFRKKIEPLNLGLSRFQDEKLVHFMNIGELFKTSDGGVPREIMHDGVHLTEKGYRIWADAMLPTLQGLLKE